MLVVMGAGGELHSGGPLWGDGSDGQCPGAGAGPHGHVLPAGRGGARSTHSTPPQVLGPRLRSPPCLHVIHISVSTSTAVLITSIVATICYVSVAWRIESSQLGWFDVLACYLPGWFACQPMCPCDFCRGTAFIFWGGTNRASIATKWLLGSMQPQPV